MIQDAKFLVVSTERSGSSMTSAILANAGADFGFDKGREWYRGEGDYEHPIIVDTYKNLKRAKLFHKFSDRLTEYQNKRITLKMRNLYSKVSFAKYPPLSQYLPVYIKRADLDVRLIVVIRKFNDFALSMISRHGGDLETCKTIYLNTYQPTLINLSLYGGCIICYEDVINLNETKWADIVEESCGLKAERLINERNKMVKPTFLKNEILNLTLDQSCEDLYGIYRDLSGSVYNPNYVKQHVKKDK